MHRKKTTINRRRQKVNERLAVFQRMVMGELMNRTELGTRMGWQYGNYRKLYKALGYPEDKDLNFSYFWNKYDRHPVATAVIDRPANKSWTGDVKIIEAKTKEEDSKLLKEWNKLEEEHNVKRTLKRLDKLMGIGKYGILLFGFSDVKNKEQFKLPAGGTPKLLYLKPYTEKAAKIHEYVNKTDDPRYGQPLTYKIEVASLEQGTEEIVVHYTRVMHVVDEMLINDNEGRERLRPIVNALENIEKVLGGDAEMFWRGARPGYHLKPQENFAFGDEEIEQLEDELDKFEHDLRRILVGEGIDEIKALAMQIADPANHLDVQLQAISAQTGIPKRILVGSERGELSSSQDKGEWLELIKTRREEFAEPVIVRPFVDKLMELKILTSVEEYNVQWEDLFAPSDEDRAKLGEIRARAVKEYAANPMAEEIVPPQLVYRFLLGLTEEEAEEIIKVREEFINDEERRAEELDREVQSALAQERALQPGNGNGQDQNQPPPQVDNKIK